MGSWSCNNERGRRGGPAGQFRLPQPASAAISGFVPTMFMTRVRLWRGLRGPFRLRALEVSWSGVRRITRWEHEHLLEAVQERLDANPQAMRQRRETVEHPFGSIKARMPLGPVVHRGFSEQSWHAVVR